jgi:hypothetical protein
MAALDPITFAILSKDSGFFCNRKESIFSHGANGRPVCHRRQVTLGAVYRAACFEISIALLAVLWLVPSHSFAREIGEASDDGPERSEQLTNRKEPPHLLARIGPGASVRFRKDEQFDQGWLAPAFIDVTGAYLWSGRGRLRHAIGLAASCNLTADGGYTEPIYPGEQWVLAPLYLALYTVNAELALTGRVGPEFTVSNSKAWGIGFTAGASYYLLAGFGPFAEAGVDVYFGENASVHPLMSLQIGLFVDHELLP